MPSPEEPIETEAAPPKMVPPTPAPPSFGLSGSVGQDDPQQPPGAPSSPWWAPENLGGPSPAQAAQATQEEDAADDPQGAQDVHEAQAAPEAEAPEADAPEAAPVAVPEEASGAAPADRGVVTPSPGMPHVLGRPGSTVTMPMPMPMAAPVRGGEVTQPTPVIVPAAHLANGGPAPVDGVSPPTDVKRGFGGRRRLVLMGAGAVAAIAVGVAGVTAVSGSSRPEPAARSGSPGGAAAPPPSRSPANSKRRSTTAPSIDNEKTDRRPLRLSEIFPARPLTLGGRAYRQDTTSVNHDCALVARGAMAAALVRRHCRGVVRATYVDTKKQLAVTAGVVAMPTRSLAVAARKAGAPSQYEWFRGMPGKVAKNIDQAGGYAASTVRGRYIIYSYTAYLDGHAAGTGDQLLTTVGRQFVAYAVRPVERRSH